MIVRQFKCLLFLLQGFELLTLAARETSFLKAAVKQGSQACSYSDTFPLQYTAYKTSSLSASTLDGDLSKGVWAEVPWTEDFVDISTTTLPKHRTRAKMRWDDDFLYVAAELEEPNVWATLVEHDTVIFQDNDFEVFIDAAATNHYYKEFEMNAFNTTWDLCLNKPYGDGGYENSSRVFPESGFDMQPPLRSAAKIYPESVINDPSTPNVRWSVEIAIPLQQAMFNSTTKKPTHGSIWRINFSRVQWHAKTDATTNKYIKDPSCQSCPTPGTKAEDNWVWSPQGEISMHLPERWAIMQFSDEAVASTPAAEYSEWASRGAAMALYYAEHAYAKDHGGKFTDDIGLLKDYSAAPFHICDEASVQEISLSDGGFVAKAASPSSPNFVASVTQDRFLTVAAAHFVAPQAS